MESDITSIEFDFNHRKLVVGDHYGNIKVFDIVSGIEIYQLHAHDSEISFLGYGGRDNTIVTMSWDKRILIHRDEKPVLGEAFDDEKAGSKRKTRGNTMRGKADAHAGDIICGDYSHNLGLIVTGGRDYKVKIWDYERVKLESEFGGHQETLVLAKFIEPFELLLTADQSGVMYLWSIAELAHNKPKCLVEWRNMFTLQQMCPITAVDSHWDTENQKLSIFVGDEMGFVRVLDATAIVKEEGFSPKDVTDLKKRNPYRILNIDHEVRAQSVEFKTIEEEGKITPVLEEENLNQISQWKAHKDAIKFIKFVKETDDGLIFTAGLDRMARLWTKSGKSQGALKQGKIKKKKETPWTFSLQNYDEQNPKRVGKVEQMLEDSKKLASNRQQKKDKSGLNQTEISKQRKRGRKIAHQTAEMAQIKFDQENDSAFQGSEEGRSKVQKLLDMVKRVQKRDQGFEAHPDLDSDEEEKRMQQRIGPFSFDIDEEIDTDILSNAEVYKDLKELDDILPPDETQKAMAAHQMGRSKRRKR